MALHNNLWQLAKEAIDEYLVTSQLCLKYQKADGGCLGYPATLLLLSAVNALGTYLRNESVLISGKQQRITRGEPFRVFNHPLFGQSLTHQQIKIVEHSYRNLLSHNAMLSPQHFLVPGPGGPPFTFENGRVAIYVDSFYEMVNRAWQHFDKDRIKFAVDSGYV
jgi:hypothetical protein